jgi:hypothetical protein
MKCEGCGSSHYSTVEFHKCSSCGKEICVSCQVVTVEESFTVKHDVHYCEDCAPEVYTYPEGFHDFGRKGVPQEKETIKEWLNQCRKSLMYKEAGEFAYVGSGNTVVIGFKWEDEYSFVVAQGYKEITVENDKIKEIEF